MVYFYLAAAIVLASFAGLDVVSNGWNLPLPLLGARICILLSAVFSFVIAVHIWNRGRRVH